MEDSIKRFLYYIKIWRLLSRNSFRIILSQRIAFWFFISGKVIRFLFYLAFLHFLLNGTKQLAGYGLNETILFFLSFNLVDAISQFLFREAYRFRPKIVSGDFDLTLLKPMNTLFSVLMGGADLMDFITIPPLVAAIIYVIAKINPDWQHVILFILLILNALLIATSFYVAILAMGIITFEIDNTIMLYRELSSMGRFPIDIYREPVKSVLIFVIPVGIMMTIPAKALMGVLDTYTLFISLAIGVLLFVASIKFWNFALKKYSSASS